MKHRLFALLVSLLLIFPGAGGAEPLDDRTEEIAQGILLFKAEQSGAADADAWIAEDLPATMGNGGEWYALALHRRGADLSSCYAALLDYVKATPVRAATTRLKLALTLLATGDEAPYVRQTVADAIGKQGVMSLAWGLHLLDNGCEAADQTVEDILETLLSLRRSDGGWAITGTVSDADATAMVLQALANHRADPAVEAVVQEALGCLADMQLPSGGFASYGVESTESIAQVIIALTALGIDPLTDARFIQNGATMLDALDAFRLADGSFAHEAGGAYSESATAQVYLAMTAYACHAAGLEPLYVLNGAVLPAAEMHATLGYKPIALMGIAALAGLACLLLLVTGKRHPKNFLAVVIAAALLAGIVLVTEVQSADSYYLTAIRKEETVGTITLSIRCDTVAGRAAHIPADGVILPPTSLPIAEGDTVYTLLTDAARLHGLHLDASGAPGMMYLHGIANLYEFDFGELSGWVFLVNGASSSLGCDQVRLQDGDTVEWRYSCELGRDIP